tara:strand:- start:165 stop:452 length:288 start_codon:yes stop_codon:yes gene_type:complete
MAVTASVTPGFTFETSVEIDSASLNLLGTPSVSINAISATSITFENYNVSNAPSNGTAGRVIYVTDGNLGNPCLAVDNGSAWKVVALGATISGQP